MNTIDEVLNIISKISDKDVEEKFSKFVKYFKESMKTSNKSSNKIPEIESTEELNEKEMLDEIANFVKSKDFKHFYKNCNYSTYFIDIKKLSKSPPQSPSKFNRNPK
jgi:CO dehydrogenase/acetyl-CoA synthase epsilon subunit